MLKLLRGLAGTKVVTEDVYTETGCDTRGLPFIEGNACPEHCSICLDICPTGAMSETGADARQCINCHRCLEECPGKHITAAKNQIIAPAKSLEEVGEEIREKVKGICKKSLHIRYVDAGACNACDFEINSLTNPVYDIQQYGVDFVASPRHADMLLVTGVVTRNLEIALLKTYEACPQPALVVAVGSCACGGGLFKEAYAAGGGVDKHLPVDIYVPGCPPAPALIAQGILSAIKRL